MQDLIQQIRAANASGLYFVALFSTLALPDICSALEAADGLATGARYIDWFNRHVAPRYGGSLDGETCWQFRCSMLHQGTTQHPRGRYARVLFLEPGASRMIMHNNVIMDALNIDVRIFCEDLCAAADAWLPAAQRLPQFPTNFARFVRRYPKGLPPYIVGTPVIG